MDELSLNYATALYDILGPSKRESGLEELKWCSSLLLREDDFRHALSSPNLSPQEKEKLLDETFGKVVKTPHLISFLKVIISHHRLKKLPSIAEAYASLLHADLGVKEGIVYSAIPLKEEEVASLNKAFQKKLGARVSLNNIVDPRLLGGVKVAVDGKIFDASLQAKITDLHRKLNGGI